MKVKYTKAYLNVVEENTDVQLELLTIKDDLFLDAKVVEHDSFNVKIEYQIKEYRPINKLEYSYDIERKRAVLTVIEVIKKASNFYILDVSPENLYFDSCLHVRMLKRRLKIDYTINPMIDEVKALYVCLMSKYEYDDIIAAGNLIVKKYDKKLSGLTTLDEISAYLDELCTLEIDTFHQSEEIVKSKKIKKMKIIRNSTIILALISVAIVCYVMMFKVDIYVKELSAEENYANEKYADVVTDLEGVSFSEMNLHTKYIMSQSAIRTAPLQEFQKENLIPIVTMQSSGDLLEYWVSFGQKDYTKARDIATIMEDIELQIFANLALLEDVKNDKEMDDVKKTEEIAKIQGEIDGLLSELEKSTDEE